VDYALAGASWHAADHAARGIRLHPRPMFHEGRGWFRVWDAGKSRTGGPRRLDTWGLVCSPWTLRPTLSTRVYKPVKCCLSGARLGSRLVD
jgi:hypothetical protein